MKNSAFFTLDEYGIRNYRARYLALLSVGALYLIIGLFSILLLHWEAGVEGANINSYADAFWTLQMSASTIGLMLFILALAIIIRSLLVADLSSR